MGQGPGRPGLGREKGVVDPPVTLKALEENIDEKQPANFNREQILKEFKIDGEGNRDKPA